MLYKARNEKGLGRQESVWSVDSHRHYFEDKEGDDYESSSNHVCESSSISEGSLFSINKYFEQNFILNLHSHLSIS